MMLPIDSVRRGQCAANWGLLFPRTAFCFMAVLRGILNLDIISGGKNANTAKGTEGRAERRQTEMTWQMVDWRLSPWEETPGSQLGEGTVM